ncbi:TetR family transcriptional regulator [Nocardioides sp. YIM 152315]|uniref:TetR family transcriptional regulator n=1 Tax=Nocardioides sp. YIM 152315 TaxID=3031760 RepID=UPI0023DA3CA1|nr:TetR family transcriptional regulator [Nocardioides sp. YIM 152315]MDF1603729.1 TetR family transcriptional regulator [Nocardioides sp. YIM 152315]
MTEQATGRREARKASTRRALEDAALRRFADEGYDDTSVDAIAADAGVSSRTFFRYFATKDEVLDMGRAERQAELRGRIRELATTDLGPLDVVRTAVVELARGFESDRERVLLRQRAAATSPLLRGRLYDTFHSWEHVVARELGDDVSARTLAAVGFAVFRASTATWVDDGGSLPEIVEQGFRSLA